MAATLHPSRTNSTPQRQRHLSPLRAAVLDIIIRSKRPIGAYEVLDALSAKMGRAFFPTSVYRILGHLVQTNSIMRVECLNAYVALTPRTVGNTVLFICESCGNTAGVPDKKMTDALTEDAAKLGFAINHRALEIQGLCSNCQPHAAF